MKFDNTWKNIGAPQVAEVNSETSSKSPASFSAPPSVRPSVHSSIILAPPSPIQT